MTKIRTIKPELNSFPNFVMRSKDAQLLLLLLKPFADCNGRHPYCIDAIKLKVPTFINESSEYLEQLIAELIVANLLQQYIADGNKYLQYVGFRDKGHPLYEKIDRPTYIYPEPNTSNIRRTYDEQTVPEGKGMEGNGKVIYLPLSNHQGSSADPQIFLKVPLRDGSEHKILKSDIEFWKTLYPQKDVEQEIRNLVGWNIGNPDRRKTKTGIRRHIFTWLSKAQSVRGLGNATATNSTTHQSMVERTQIEQQQIRARIAAG